MVESFFQGDLKIKWQCPTNDAIIVDGYLPNESIPVISFKGKLMQVGAGQRGFGHGFQTAQHTAYQNSFNGREKRHLCIVMMLRFLAAKGSQLDGVSDDILEDILDSIVKMCTQLHMYHDIVYAKLILADIAYNKGYNKPVLKVIKVAEALEAAKRYQEAGELYCEMADPDKFQRIRDAPAQTLHGYAGLAFKRAQDYVSAEREYVTALREAGPNWSRDIRSGNARSGGNHSGDNLANMMIFYEIVHQAVVNGLKTDEAHKRMQRACHLLVGLLSVAGYRHPGNTMFSPDTVEMCQDALKPEYKNSANRAMQAVVHATLAPTIDEYHQHLLDCMVYDEYHFVSMYSRADQEEMQAEFLRDQRIKSRESARDVLN